MIDRKFGVLLFALALIPARAGAQSVPALPAAPQLRLILLTGELRVEADGGPDAVADQGLPYIRSGSIVRILSGRAEFESSYHAMIRARKGDAFSFVANPSDGTRPGIIRIAAVTDNEEPSLNVNVGDKRFRIHRGGVVVVVGAASGESAVHVEGGSILEPAVDVSLERALLALSRAMPPGSALVVGVSTTSGFANRPVRLSELARDRDDDASFELWALHPSEFPQVSMVDRSAQTISGWPGISQRVAEFIMNKYGVPDQLFADKLIWNDNGPWQQTIVYRNGQSRDDEDVISQTINYDIPRRTAAQLAKMDIGLAVDRRHAELSATSDSEETNFLAINMAIYVVSGKYTPAQALNLYTRTIALAEEGKSSASREKFLFPRP